MPEAHPLLTSIALLKGAVDTIKSAKSLINDPCKKQAAELAIQQAEQCLMQAQITFAKDIGYEICRCTFPPNICPMTSLDVYTCPACGTSYEI